MVGCWRGTDGESHLLSQQRSRHVHTRHISQDARSKTVPAREEIMEEPAPPFHGAKVTATDSGTSDRLLHCL